MGGTFMRRLLVAGLGLVLLGLVQPASPAPPDETAALLKALKNENRQVRLRAVRDLGNRGAAARAAVPALAELLREPDRDLPGQAAKALARIGPAVPELIQALRDDEIRVRYAAAQ